MESLLRRNKPFLGGAPDADRPRTARSKSPPEKPARLEPGRYHHLSRDGGMAERALFEAARALSDPRVDPNDDGGSSLLAAPAFYNQDKVVAFLLADPRFSSAAVTDALRFAVGQGGARHDATVALLLKDPRSDPAARDNEVLREALSSGFPNIVALLLADPRVNPATAFGDPEWPNALVCCAQHAAAFMGRRSKSDRRSAANFAEIAALLLADPRTDPADLDRPEFAPLRACPPVASALALRRRWSPLRAAWVAAAVAAAAVAAAAHARADAELAGALAGC